jgi:hypothetical protein
VSHMRKADMPILPNRKIYSKCDISSDHEMLNPQSLYVGKFFNLILNSNRLVVSPTLGIYSLSIPMFPQW